ncbi:NADP-dependent oxidoreductase RED1 [Ceratocystis fimbriata CBS 114723]|uniref:Dehydrogenase FUB6 n=1 Tax=Ceratocystis fimbriata CBS 114723 TaxID=1035309 RepID=A0A2C5XDY5_9PEZI|nr:NADP-dependent oxidoreductase RED1 [Ceratocystis fimbriata CBS 114723]
MVQNNSVIYKKLPERAPVVGEHLVLEDRPVDVDNAKAPPGGLYVKVLWASLDPYMRGRLRDPKIPSYVSPYELNGPISGYCVCKVLHSDNSSYAVGDLVASPAALAEYSPVPAQAMGHVNKIKNDFGLSLGQFVGALGMPGVTAYEGLYRIGKPKKGETVFVSSAAGAVGQMVGQLAKMEGCFVIGSVGSKEKVDFVTKELGFDAAFNYKEETPEAALTRLAPKGVDIYYENVGAEHLDAALNHMNVKGRIICCGMISQYNTPASERYGIKNYMSIVTKQLAIEGFIVQYNQETVDKLREYAGPLIKEGKIVAKLDITNGIGAAADGFVGMLAGKNFGKAVVKIAE